MSSDLTYFRSLGEIRPEQVPQKRAGLAFLLSFLIPGAGQFYCGRMTRGWIVLGLWLFVVPGVFIGSTQMIRGYSLMIGLTMWVFSFLDAYFTAAEINAGQDAQVDVQNPRVAVALNLLTAGFGYFYLGERSKGLAIFIGTQIVRFAIPRVTGFSGGVVSLILIVVQMVMAADAYRIAHAQVHEALGAEGMAARTQALKRSRLPSYVPIALSVILGAGFILLTVVGVAINAARQ